MRRVHSQNTPAEVLLRKALWRSGFRYTIAPTGLVGKPDIALSGRKIAIFIDGDYWRDHQWRRCGLRSLDEQFARSIADRRAYWLTKIRQNMSRDVMVTSDLLQQRWTVIRFWESDVLARLGDCVEVTVEAARTSAKWSPYTTLAQRTFAEFFAGIGLMRIGLERQGWRSVFANDIDTRKFEMYRAHFPDAAETYVVEDVYNLPVDRVPSLSLATASFPCTDLSLAGAREGLKGTESGALWGFTRARVHNHRDHDG